MPERLSIRRHDERFQTSGCIWGKRTKFVDDFAVCSAIVEDDQPAEEMKSIGGRLEYLSSRLLLTSSGLRRLGETAEESAAFTLISRKCNNSRLNKSSSLRNFNCDRTLLSNQVFDLVLFVIFLNVSLLIDWYGRSFFLKPLIDSIYRGMKTGYLHRGC